VRRIIPSLIFALLVAVSPLALAGNDGSAPGSAIVAYVSGTISRGCPAEGCEWRVFDPAAGEDRLLLRVPAFPHNVYWTEDFAWVYYRAGDRFFRAEWRWGAGPEELVQFPAHLTEGYQNIVEVWHDLESERWRMKTYEWLNNTDTAGVWEYVPEEQRWDVLTKVPTECEGVGRPCTDVVNDYVHKNDVISLNELLTKMRVEYRLQELGLTAGTGVRARVELGDTLHAMAPLLYVSRDGTEETVYSEDEECYKQIAFQEEGGFLLVTAEYTGSCAKVIEMRTGKTVGALSEVASGAVWVQAPRGRLP
jgi:hypothetical protein